MGELRGRACRVGPSAVIVLGRASLTSMRARSRAGRQYQAWVCCPAFLRPREEAVAGLFVCRAGPCFPVAAGLGGLSEHCQLEGVQE